jgi:hypothetical protein
MMLQASLVVRPERVDGEWKTMLGTIDTLTSNRTNAGEQFTTSLDKSPWHVSLGPVQMDLGHQQQALVGHTARVFFRTPKNQLRGPSPYGKSPFDFGPWNVDFVAGLDGAGELRWSACRDPGAAGLGNNDLASWLIDRLIEVRAAYREHYHQALIS